MGISLYTLDQKGYLPAGAYPSPPTPRIRWADAIWPYMTMREMYLSPQLNGSDLARMVTPFAHDTTMTFGGYGYNYQYLGNGRHVATWSSPYNVPFHARISSIQSPSNTIMLCDTEGTKAEQSNNTSGRTMTRLGQRTASTPAIPRWPRAILVRWAHVAPTAVQAMV